MSLGEEMLEQIRATTERIALELGVIGLINIQYGVAGGELYVIEANPRASRTVPFVSKAIGVPLAKVACRLMLGEKLADQELPRRPAEPRQRQGGGAALRPLRRRRLGARAGDEEHRRGDGHRRRLPDRVRQGAGRGRRARCRLEGSVFITVTDTDKPAATQLAARFHDLGFEVIATGGTAQSISLDGGAGDADQQAAARARRTSST